MHLHATVVQRDHNLFVLKKIIIDNRKYLKKWLQYYHFSNKK